MAASQTTVRRAPQFESCRYLRPQVKAVVFYPTETLLGLAAYQVTLHPGLVITFDQSDGKAQLYVVLYICLGQPAPPQPQPGPVAARLQIVHYNRPPEIGRQNDHGEALPRSHPLRLPRTDPPPTWAKYWGGRAKAAPSGTQDRKEKKRIQVQSSTERTGGDEADVWAAHQVHQG